MEVKVAGRCLIENLRTLRNIEHRSKNAALKFGLMFAQFDKRIAKITDFLWRDAFLNSSVFPRDIQ